MTITEWQSVISLILGVAAGIGVVLAFLRFYIRTFTREELEKGLEDVVHELKPNSGSSIKDQVTRLEAAVNVLVKDNESMKKSQEQSDSKINKIYELFIEYVTNK